MAHTPNPQPWIDLSEFQKNNTEVPLEVLLPYVGQYVAWSLDGTRILASPPSREELSQRLREIGIETGTVVFDYVSDPNESWL